MAPGFFATNRRRLTEVCDEGVVVMAAYVQLQRGNDAAFSFEQEANFWWLTGINAPDWQLIIDLASQQSWLVAPTIDDVHQLFGGGLGHDEALATSGVNGVLSRDEAVRKLRDLATKTQVAWTVGADPYAEHYDFRLNPALAESEAELKEIFSDVRSVRRELARLRAIKQPEEIAAMQAAIDLTADAFSHVEALLPSFSYEYEVEAAFTHFIRGHGAAGHAYDPIVAGGVNACTLHYNTNAARLNAGELLLLDIGARYQGYVADITRTYAIGEVSDRRRTVHAAVARAQREIIELIAPGVSVREYHDRVDDIMKRELIGLGLMNNLDDTTSYRRYFPHAISHGLGVDVHDSLGGPDVFTEGMVLTVEPGIYIPEEAIGVRIEDDILITASGHRNLSGRLSTELP